MELGKDTLKKQARELIEQGFILPEDIPSIDLYMDQVTTFMDKYLSKNKRTEEEKTLTKTMINNYTKNDLLPPSNKKKYSKKHIIILIFIYYLKNVFSINDIQTMIDPLINEYFQDEADFSLEEIYKTIFELEKKQYFNTESSLVKTLELSEKSFPDKEDEYLKNLSFLSLLSYDIFVKKRLMERIIDEMKSEEEK